MNKELSDKLREEFPTLLSRLRYRNPECGDGWYELIREFGLAVNKLQNPERPVIVFIIKEKMGRLEIQGCTNMNEELWKTVNKITNKSLKTCDQCGKQGELRCKEDEIFCLWATRCTTHAMYEFEDPDTGEVCIKEMTPIL